jgi:Integrase core domain
MAYCMTASGKHHPSATPWDTAPRYLLRDRDASYGPVFRDRVRVMGNTEVVTAPRSPWQNSYVERLIGSIRRECLDHIIIFNEHHDPFRRGAVRFYTCIARTQWRPEPMHGAHVAAVTNVLFDYSKIVSRDLHRQTDSQTG